ncbi:transporter substrate-binding domain-containing protein [Deinococcus yavapaiensis]|uniref:Amino acid ABC transporter substrate-binding protein (PAAT family) n=1 Tax=Deinococcus yavapaiensis KR-236 TaxID=694435 RepID=A0A318RZL6_9DEIO|nr:transporter substrate-binding domain-containing protein [Deinococcus yavapaiensis]PYE49388.1 amino acid ABC transporter substrate-binding protein (PAAT family) [Deinococcus yavapaiensis KR-236]
MRNILFILTALAVTSAPAASPDLLTTVKQRGTLKIAMEGTYPPFNYRDEKGQLVGFDVDVATEIARRLGLKPQFVLTEWSGIIAGLQANKYDVIVNQVAITPERQKSLDFTSSYVVSSPQFIVRKNETRAFKSLNDLKGKKLGVGTGSNYEQIARAVGGIDIRTYKAAPDTLRDLSLGRIDAALNDRLLAAYLVKQSGLPVKPGAAIQGERIEMGIPVRKGNPLFVKAVNKALADMKADGTYAKISNKWFGQDVSK